MASVHILSAVPAGPEEEQKAHLDLDQLRESARADRFGEHRLVEDPAAADLILFVETSWAAGYYFERVRGHPVFREFPAKCYLFSATDKVVPFVPGVFASIERRWYWPAWTRSGAYPGIREGGELSFEAGVESSWLFSFVGTAGASAARGQILALDHPRGLLIDSTADGGSSPADYRRRYVASIRDSAFVLCPRGGGTSSFRLFETMLLGRVPVVVSDQWVPPVGPEWERFSLRVPESEVGSIPALLESRADEAAAMGEAARQAWLEWFAADALFHRTVGWCLELSASAASRQGLRRHAPWLQMARPYHAARAVAKRLGHGSDAQA